MIDKIDLSGKWDFKFDEKDCGKDKEWFKQKPKNCQWINIPSCWNEIFRDHHYYDRTAWFFKQIYCDKRFLKRRAVLCFEGVNYFCDVYVNGEYAGSHEGGFTFFSFDITNFIRLDSLNSISIRVNGEHSEWTIPPSGVDWFNYCGLYRPVYIELTDYTYINDYTIITKMDGSIDLNVQIKNQGKKSTYRLITTISDENDLPVTSSSTKLNILPDKSTNKCIKIKISDPHLWNLESPYLYCLKLELMDSTDNLCDRISKRFGIREFGIEGQKILINGKEVKLIGCSKHDEYPMTGRTVTREQLVKDYSLFTQMNANFVRLCHYPHSQKEHEILNELGVVSMAEIPLVFLHEKQMTSKEILKKAKKMLAEIVQREKNETNIIFWSLFIECDTHLPSTKKFVREIIDFTKSLDTTRFIIMASVRPLNDVTYEHFDIIGMNYWEGWYREAPLEQSIEWLTKMAEKYPDKPLLITSHGWEGMFQFRSYAEKSRWSEDLQSDYLSSIADIFMSFKNIVGEIIWTFTDFHVSNWEDAAHPILHRKRYLERPREFNHKGMVNFYREPKSTYYVIQKKFSEWKEYMHSPVHTVENLKIRFFSNRKLLGNAAAFDFIDKVQSLLQEKKFVNVMFDLDLSQIEFIESLTRNRMFVDWSRIHAFHLKEYVGADINTEYGKAHRLKVRLADILPFGRFEYLRGNAKDLDAECQRYSKLIEENPVDIVCIGIGNNGRIAFNDSSELDLKNQDSVKVVDLDQKTKEEYVWEGVFSNIEQVPSKGITLTIPYIIKAKTIFCMSSYTYHSMAAWKKFHSALKKAISKTALKKYPCTVMYLADNSIKSIPAIGNIGI